MLDSVEFQTVIVAVVVFLLFVYLLQNKQSLNLPPGPKGWPIVGSVLSLGKPGDVAANISKLRKKFNSDIIHMKMGCQDMIVIYDFELLRRAYNSDIFVDRADIFLNRVSNNFGVVAASGNRWKESRRLALHTLRDFGMGKNRIESTVQDEIFYLCEEIEKFGGKPFSPRDPFETAVSNVIGSINFGNRFDYGDKDFHWLQETARKNLRMIAKSEILNYVPWCRFIPGDIFGLHGIIDRVSQYYAYIQTRIDEHRESFDENGIRDMIDAFLQKQKADDPDDIYSDEQIRVMVTDFFVAGTETTAKTLQWLILAMIRYPDIQDRVRKEIDAVVPRERYPTMADRAKLPYTMAVISEAMRLFVLLPYALPHSNPRPAEFGGYDIPKKSIVIYSARDIMRDPNYWPNGDEFDPVSNFLDKDGNYVNRDRLIPFGIGKRACPGESLARVEVFLYFTTLIQQFTFRADENKPTPEFTEDISIVVGPQEYTVIAELRKLDSEWI